MGINNSKQEKNQPEEQKVNQVDQSAPLVMSHDLKVAQQEIVSDELKNAAKGCIIGAFIGDAAGAVLEFKGSIKLDDVEKALTFPGGGVLRVKLSLYFKAKIN